MAESQKLEMFGRMLENVNLLQGNSQLTPSRSLFSGSGNVMTPLVDPQVTLLQVMDPSHPTTIDVLARKSGLGLSVLTNLIDQLKSMGIIIQNEVDGEVAYSMSTSGMKLRQVYATESLR